MNAIAYYSSNIFVEGGFSQTSAILASFGFGAVNFVFAGPAVWTIDTFGRRNLLLVSFPLMALMLLMTGFALYVLVFVSACWLHGGRADDGGRDVAGYRNRTRRGLGSSRLGFICSPLRTRLVRAPCRSRYVSIAHAVASITESSFAVLCRSVPAVRTRHWHVPRYRDALVLVRTLPLLPSHVSRIPHPTDAYALTPSNFVVALTVPALLGAWTPQGTFGWFAAWNVFGFVMSLLFVPETKALSLEELDQVFGVPTRTHAAYQVKSAVRWVRRCVLRQRVERMPPLYEHEGAVGEKRYKAGGVGAA